MPASPDTDSAGVQTFDPQEAWAKVFQRKLVKKEIAIIQREYPHRRSLVIPYNEVASAGPGGIQLAEEILENPGKAIEDCQDAIRDNHLIVMKDGKTPAKGIVVRFTGLTKKTFIKNLRVDHINRMVALDVQVKRVSSILPLCLESIFRCKAGHFTVKKQHSTKWTIPDGCATDGCTFKKLDFVPKRSKFTDTQRIQIQEVVESLSGGEQAQMMNAELRDDLCGKVFPGDRIIVNGIVRSYQKYASGTPTPTFNTYLEVNSIEVHEREFEEVTLSEEDEEEIRKLAKSPNIFDRVAASIAPNIYGFDDVKHAYALAMFSGRQEIQPNGDTDRMDVHVLVVGDYGLAKSKVALAVTRLVPRAIYVSGQSTSKAGLTVSVTKDEGGDGRFQAEAGAMPLADLGIIVIDEMDKLHPKDRDAALEAMETQKITVAKAGLYLTMNSRCGVLGVANPKYGRFDMNADLAEQIVAGGAILSRYDLIYLKNDEPNEAKDTEIATTILNKTNGVIDYIQVELLRKFVAYTKKQPNPELNAAAKEKIIKYYVSIRSKAKKGGAVPLTARATGSLKRIATAHAKMRLAREVTLEDAEVAIRILEQSLKGVAWDEKTGTFDSDKIGPAGVSHDKRGLIEHVIWDMRQKGAEIHMVSAEAVAEDIAKRGKGSRMKILETIEGLRKDGTIFEVQGHPGHYQFMKGV